MLPKIEIMFFLPLLKYTFAFVLFVCLNHVDIEQPSLQNSLEQSISMPAWYLVATRVRALVRLLHFPYYMHLVP